MRLMTFLRCFDMIGLLCLCVEWCMYGVSDAQCYDDDVLCNLRHLARCFQTGAGIDPETSRQRFFLQA